MSGTVSETLEDRCRDLEKTLKNIVAVADSQGSVAHRFNVMRDIAEKALLKDEEPNTGI